MIRPALLIAASIAAVGVSAASDTVERYTKRDGALEVVKGAGVATFKVQSNVGQQSCSVDGKAILTEPSLAVSASDDPTDQCVVTIKFIPGGARVTTKACEDYCGLNAAGSMDGTYKAVRR